MAPSPRIPGPLLLPPLSSLTLSSLRRVMESLQPGTTMECFSAPTSRVSRTRSSEAEIATTCSSE
jgi:hypothetical protein